MIHAADSTYVLRTPPSGISFFRTKVGARKESCMERDMPNERLVEELMLQINESLFRKGIIPEQVYEQAKIKIVEHRQR